MAHRQISAPLSIDYVARQRAPDRERGSAYLGRRSHASRPLELQPRQPRIKPVHSHELRMRALLDDPALVHHQDAVAGEHGSNAV